MSRRLVPFAVHECHLPGELENLAPICCSTCCSVASDAVSGDILMFGCPLAPKHSKEKKHFVILKVVRPCLTFCCEFGCRPRNSGLKIWVSIIRFFRHRLRLNMFGIMPISRQFRSTRRSIPRAMAIHVRSPAAATARVFRAPPDKCRNGLQISFSQPWELQK